MAGFGLRNPKTSTRAGVWSRRWHDHATDADVPLAGKGRLFI